MVATKPSCMSWWKPASSMNVSSTAYHDFSTRCWEKGGWCLGYADGIERGRQEGGKTRDTQKQTKSTYSVHVLMRDEKEGRKKQARSNKPQFKAKQHNTPNVHYSHRTVQTQLRQSRCRVYLHFRGSESAKEKILHERGGDPQQYSCLQV